LFEFEVEEGLSAWLERINTLPFVSSASIENLSARVLVKDVCAEERGLLASLEESGSFLRRFEVEERDFRYPADIQAADYSGCIYLSWV
jgi:hypothetical protein